ncbi:MAG: hypothetical protein EBR60_11100 [Burkholderiaceae bacterium]|nr:hypothetical protein [Burkholderiaceae bacterium]
MLETKLADKTWTETQDDGFIKSLEQLRAVIEQLSSQIYLFVSYFEQYYNAVANSPLFNEEAATSDSDNGEVFPTQTSAAAPNRAQRRAVKRTTSFQAQGIDNA